MSILSDIFSKTAGEVVKSAGEVVDSISTTDEEKLAKKNQLTKIITDGLNTALAIQAATIQSETTGNSLQRNWRPILMLGFGFIVMYSKFIAPAFSLPNTILEAQFWSLLELGIGGYVIGRSVEKVADTVTKKVDMPFLKKKDRDDS